MKAASRMLILGLKSRTKTTIKRRRTSTGQTKGSNQASQRHEALRNGTYRRASLSERKEQMMEVRSQWSRQQPSSKLARKELNAQSASSAWCFHVGTSLGSALSWPGSLALVDERDNSSMSVTMRCSKRTGQSGLTGSTRAPALSFAVGLSGRSNFAHWVGMRA